MNRPDLLTFYLQSIKCWIENSLLGGTEFRFTIHFWIIYYFLYTLVLCTIMLLTMTFLKLSIYTQAQRELDTSMYSEIIDFLYIVYCWKVRWCIFLFFMTSTNKLIVCFILAITSCNNNQYAHFWIYKHGKLRIYLTGFWQCVAKHIVCINKKLRS